MIIKKMALGIYGANCYIIADEESEEAAVVDPGGEGKEIYKILNDMGKKCVYIILTHGHMDHIGGVEELKKLTGARVVIHEKDNEMINDPALNLSTSGYGEEISFNGDILVSEGDEIKIGLTLAKIIHTPGHTPGGMCISIGNHLFSGDTLFERSIGRTDLYGGDYEMIIKSIKNKLFKLSKDTIVHPGHGGDTTIEIEMSKNPFLR
jgi:glyoxylase-like metal-dependent hydrolase (beta-lactamase superfamily II)